ncbi:MAG TPA: alpha/beta hydrolase, partial [Mycobacterium sp.]|nr:alpha/beta hydrolase [Mycobacterium sp.]
MRLADWDGPLHLVWGLDDPVPGRHVLEKATTLLPRAEVTELHGVGHYPQSEAPQAVAASTGSLTTHRAPTSPPLPPTATRTSWQTRPAAKTRPLSSSLSSTPDN